MNSLGIKNKCKYKLLGKAQQTHIQDGGKDLPPNTNTNVNAICCKRLTTAKRGNSACRLSRPLSESTETARCHTFIVNGKIALHSTSVRKAP